MPQLPNKDPASKIPFQKQYVQDIQSPKELLQKELDVNRAEQTLLNQRIAMMKSFLSDLSSSDPQYSMILTSIQMDKIELDELTIRAEALIEKLTLN